MIDKKLFGKRIKELRESRRLTQEELSNLLDVDWQHISRLEHGKNLPSCNILLSLVRVFNVDLREIAEYNHLNKNLNIENEILKLLSEATDEQKRLCYKIIKSILK